jgi:hypothetical protein
MYKLKDNMVQWTHSNHEHFFTNESFIFIGKTIKQRIKSFIMILNKKSEETMYFFPKDKNNCWEIIKTLIVVKIHGVNFQITRDSRNVLGNITYEANIEFLECESQ